MLDQKKVILMTKIQHIADTEKKAMKANNYYQWDYLTIYMLRSFLAYCLLFVVAVVFFFLYNWEKLLTEINPEVLLQGSKGVLLGFVLLLIPVMVLSYIVYWFRYRRMMKTVKEYQDNLRKLGRDFSKDEPSDLTE